jgi:hypothetical protein
MASIEISLPRFSVKEMKLEGDCDGTLHGGVWRVARARDA